MPRSRPQHHRARIRHSAWGGRPRRAIPLIPALAASAIVAAPALPASASAPSADLATTISPAGSRLVMGPVTFTITVTNKGPNYADKVVVSDNWFGWASFQSAGATATAGTSCSAPPVGTRGTVTCTTSSLKPGDSMTMWVTVRAELLTARGILQDTATATSSRFDPDTSNNTATAVLTIIS